MFLLTLFIIINLVHQFDHGNMVTTPAEGLISNMYNNALFAIECKKIHDNQISINRQALSDSNE